MEEEINLGNPIILDREKNEHDNYFANSWNRKCMTENRDIFHSEEFKNIHSYTIKELEYKLNNINSIFCKTNDKKLVDEKDKTYFKYKSLLYDVLYEFLCGLEFSSTETDNNICISVRTGLDEYKIYTTYVGKDKRTVEKYYGKTDKYNISLTTNFPKGDYCLLQIALYTIKKYKHFEDNINEYLIKIVSNIFDSLYEYEDYKIIKKTQKEYNKLYDEFEPRIDDFMKWNDHKYRRLYNEGRYIEIENTIMHDVHLIYDKFPFNECKCNELVNRKYVLNKIEKTVREYLSKFDKQLTPTDFLWIFNTDSEFVKTIIFIGKGALGSYEYNEKNGMFTIDDVGGEPLEVKNLRNLKTFSMEAQETAMYDLISQKDNKIIIVGDKTDLEYYTNMMTYFYTTTSAEKANFELMSHFEFINLNENCLNPDVVVVPKKCEYLSNQKFIDAIRFNKL